MANYGLQYWPSLDHKCAIWSNRNLMQTWNQDQSLACILRDAHSHRHLFRIRGAIMWYSSTCNLSGTCCARRHCLDNHVQTLPYVEFWWYRGKGITPCDRPRLSCQLYRTHWSTRTSLLQKRLFIVGKYWFRGVRAKTTRPSLLHAGGFAQQNLFVGKCRFWGRTETQNQNYNARPEHRGIICSKAWGADLPSR